MITHYKSTCICSLLVHANWVRWPLGQSRLRCLLDRQPLSNSNTQFVWCCLFPPYCVSHHLTDNKSLHKTIMSHEKYRPCHTVFANQWHTLDIFLGIAATAMVSTSEKSSALMYRGPRAFVLELWRNCLWPHASNAHLLALWMLIRVEISWAW